MKAYYFLALITLLVFTSCATRVVTPVQKQKVVVVKRPPAHSKVVVVKGTRYYKWNGKYHRRTNKGYVVVKL